MDNYRHNAKVQVVNLVIDEHTRLSALYGAEMANALYSLLWSIHRIHHCDDKSEVDAVIKSVVERMENFPLDVVPEPDPHLLGLVKFYRRDEIAYPFMEYRNSSIPVWKHKPA